MTSNKRKRGPKLRRSTEEIKRIFEATEEKFFEAMRRPPIASDRIFYWSYCFSDSEFKNITIKAMIHAEISQHLIYIFDKTGFMVSKEGYKRLSKEEKEEIRAASTEYDILEEEDDGNIYKLADYDDFGSIDDDPLVQALYIFGNFIERNINSSKHRVDNHRFICAYLLIREFRLVRAIFRSQRYTTAEESLVLIRSLYEIYCKLCYACRSKKNAKYLIDSDFGLTTGEFEVFQQDGKFKRHLLLHKKSKKTIPRHRSF